MPDRTVRSSVALAAPEPGWTYLPANVDVIVDDSIPFIRQMLDAGVIYYSDPTEAQQWTSGAPVIQVVGSELPETPQTGGLIETAEESRASTGQPDESWTVDELRREADQRSVDVPSRATKAEILDLLRGHAEQA